MNKGFIRFSDSTQRSEWMPILMGIYEFEALRVSGAHGGTRRLSECAWPIEALVRYLGQALPAHPNLYGNLATLLEHLRQNRQLLTLDLPEDRLNASQPDWRKDVASLNNLEPEHHDFPPSDLGNGFVKVHITRMAELVRTTGNIREYKRRDNGARRTMIESTSWTPVLRPALNRNVDPDEVAQFLEALAPPTTPLKNHGTVTLQQGIEDLRTVLTALESGHAFGRDYKISSFQKQGIVQALRHSWFGPSSDPSASGGLVVAAGTGFGKTLAFAIPVLVDALIQTREPTRRCTQVLLYPRNDLAVDQREELNKYIRVVNDVLHSRGETSRNFGLRMDAASKIKEKQVNMPGGHLAWNICSGDSTNVLQGAKEAYAGTTSVQSASIVVASVESFRRRFTIQEVLRALGGSINRVVIDEIHLNTGVQGAHLQRILKRLRQAAWSMRGGVDTVHVVGASATIANPEEHLESITHLKKKNIRLVEAVPDDGAPLGIMNHVLYQPRSGRSMIGSIVDATSSLAHQRRGEMDGIHFADRPTAVKSIQKTIGFSDGHEIVGTWFSNFIRNEMTEEGKTATNLNPENPYAHRHFRPLRCQTDGTTQGSDVCASCSSGQLHPTPININESNLWTFVHKPDGSTGEWSSPTNLEQTHAHAIAGLGSCPHLEYGTCWWFVERDDIDALETIGAKEFKKNVVRAFRHTSQTRELSTAGGADQAFRKSGFSTAYMGTEVTAPIPHDLAIATPTLEVGIDMNNVTEVLTHKAIRNVSSYRQKIGRAGREEGTDAVAMTILARNATETNHLRTPQRLVSDPIADPVPVASENEAVLGNQAYEAAWDYLSINNLSIELIPKVRSDDAAGRTSLVNRFQQAINALSSPQCSTYISYAVGCNNALATTAADHAKRHVELFLQQHTRKGTIGNHPTFIEWLAASRSGNVFAGVPDPNDATWAGMDTIKTHIVPHLPTAVKQWWSEKDWANLQSWAAGPPLPTPGAAHPTGAAFGAAFVGLCSALVPGLPPMHPLGNALESMWARHGHSVGSYLSSTLRTIFPSVSELNQNVPFASLEALFANPSEKSVKVTWSIGGKIEDTSIPAREAMAFVLPGMWTHRLPGGRRLFANHGNDLEKTADNDDVYMMRFDKPENRFRAGTPTGTTLGTDAANVPSLLPLAVEHDTMEYQLNFIGMKQDNGAPNRQALVPLGHVNNDFRFWAHESKSSGDPRTLKRPDTYAVNWVLAEPPADVQQVSTLVASPEFLPHTGHHAPLAMPVSRHPLFIGPGIEIEVESSASIKRLALGVTRANGLWLQPHMNETPIVWTDKISTPALRVRVPAPAIKRLVDHYCDSSRPFDETVLQILGHHLIGSEQWSPFEVEPFLNCLLAVAYLDPSGHHDLPSDQSDAFTRLFASGRVPTPELCKSIADYHLPENPEDADELAAELLSLYGEFLTTKCWLNMGGLTEEWVKTNVGNGLGMMLKELVAELAGVPVSSVGYTFAHDHESGLTVTVYDDDAEGNGSINLASKYFHMPREAREISSHLVSGIRLPDMSLVDLLELRLQPCANHIINTVAIKDSDASKLPSLEGSINDLKHRHRAFWDAANVKSTREANLLRRIVSLVASETSMDVNELEAAFDVCDSGCSHCQSDASSNMFSPFLSGYTQKQEMLERLFFGDMSVPPTGYKLEVADRAQILAEAGSFIGTLRIGAHDPSDGRQIWKPFLKSTGERVMLHWPRRSDSPDVDYVVRVQEVVE